MAKPKLTVACGRYDRTKALFDGRVKAEGVDLVCSEFQEEIHDWFKRVIAKEEFDICEFSLSNYIYLRALGMMSNYVALPVFVSRKFRHADFFVNKNSGIHTPSDLIGKKVGLVSYYRTAMIYERGILSDDYGVKPDQMTWFRDTPERIPVSPPRGVKITDVDDVNAMLVSGKVDAYLGASAPKSFRSSPRVKRLFDDPKSVEKEYYKRTGEFPIMHVLILREKVWSKNKWIAKSVVDAFARANDVWRAYSASRLGGMAWVELLFEEEEDVLGDNPYKYTVKDNRKDVETLTRYCAEQAVLKKVPTVDELFADNVD